MGGSRLDAVRDVVLVHGLWYGPASFVLFRRRLEDHGFRCHAFRYSTLNDSLDESAAALRAFVKDREFEAAHLVGHSLGGLVILRMLAEFSDLPPGRVVLLGTPVKGSEVARRVAGVRLLQPFLGRARAALDDGFDRAPEGREVGVVAGVSGLGLGRIVRGLEGPNDGTVNASETMLAGVADRLELPVSHTGLMISPKVVEATARFLETGAF